jgi:two-component system, LytTR family, response regulator
MPTELHRIRTLIVDDEPIARRRIRALLAGEADVEVIGEAANGTDAVKAIVAERPELVFLDVQMPGLDGFEVIRATADRHQPFVVFVTAHDEHAIRAFEVQAVDYLLKPVVETRFRDAVQRVVRRIRDGVGGDLSRQMTQLLERVAPPPARAGAGRIAIKRDGRVNFVRVEDIDWVEADGDFVKLHAGREMHVVRETMADIALKLPAERFARIHRGVIVNADRVKEIQPWFKGDYVLILHDGTKLRSGRTYRQTVQMLIE